MATSVLEVHQWASHPVPGQAPTSSQARTRMEQDSVSRDNIVKDTCRTTPQLLLRTTSPNHKRRNGKSVPSATESSCGVQHGKQGQQKYS
eukprot:6462109-Amphidinium_carterae.1